MPAKPADKVIVTSRAALGAKYAAAGLKKIDAALGRLTAADMKRGLAAVVVDLSSAADAAAHGFKAVPAGTAAAKPYKQAVDKIFTALGRPQYVVLLGSVDVIPHVPLKNPLFDPASPDTDETADSDLPYACDAAYSLDPRKFIAPTRVVGRLPDLTGAGAVAYLTGLIDTAAAYAGRPAADYDACFALSCDAWRDSTETSVKKIFGQNAAVQLSPPVKYKAPAPKGLGRLAHFINCHGGAASPMFVGQAAAGAFQDALHADQVSGAAAEGAVVAAECCYGAQLYNPQVAVPPAMGICNAYLQKKAYGFFGSSTIAYGPAAGNGLADLVCVYFLRAVRGGASLGRACLQARLDYVRNLNGKLTGHDLKTLAQFNLVGDPAVTPVRAAAPEVVKAVSLKAAPKGVAGDAVAAVTRAVADRLTRNGRREWLRGYAATISATTACVTDVVVNASLTALTKGLPAAAGTTAEDKGVGRLLREAAAKMNLTNPAVMVFGMASASKSPAPRLGIAPKGGPTRPVERVHVVMERVPAKNDAGDPPAKTVHIRGFEAVESNGILQIREFVSR